MPDIVWAISSADHLPELLAGLAAAAGCHVEVTPHLEPAFPLAHVVLTIVDFDHWPFADRSPPALEGIDRTLVNVIGLHSADGIVCPDLGPWCDEVFRRPSGEEQGRREHAAWLHRSLHRILEAARVRRLLHRQQRLLVMGEVMAGVLHELKNPLNNIVAAADRLKPAPAADHEAASAATGEAAARPEASPNDKWVDVVKRNAELLRRSVTQLLAGLRENPARETVEVADLMDEAADYALKGDIAHRRLTVDRDYRRPCLVHASPGQLLHVFLNLIVNARQMLEGADGGAIRLACRRSDDRVVCEVADTGAGIHPSVMDRLFEPFLTTKEAGTGLGLSLVRRLAAENGGTVTARNGVGGGAVFELSFPTATTEDTGGTAGTPP